MAGLEQGAVRRQSKGPHPLREGVPHPPRAGLSRVGPAELALREEAGGNGVSEGAVAVGPPRVRPLDHVARGERAVDVGPARPAGKGHGAAQERVRRDGGEPRLRAAHEGGGADEGDGDDLEREVEQVVAAGLGPRARGRIAAPGQQRSGAARNAVRRTVALHCSHEGSAKPK